MLSGSKYMLDIKSILNLGYPSYKRSSVDIVANSLEAISKNSEGCVEHVSG